MERTITVTGKGKVSVKPDIIRVKLKASDVCEKYEDTVKKSAEDMGIVREAIKKAGLKQKDLKTTSFQIDTKYESFRDLNDSREYRLVGYEYRHDLYIEIPNDNKKLGKLMYQLANCHINVEFSIKYGVKDLEDIRNRTLENAIKDSKTKAEIISKALGASLGDAIDVKYSSDEVDVYFHPILARSLAMENSNGEDYEFDIEADDLDFDDSVTIIWQLI